MSWPDPLLFLQIRAIRVTKLCHPCHSVPCANLCRVSTCRVMGHGIRVVSLRVVCRANVSRAVAVRAMSHFVLHVTVPCHFVAHPLYFPPTPCHDAGFGKPCRDIPWCGLGSCIRAVPFRVMRYMISPIRAVPGDP